MKKVHKYLLKNYGINTLIAIKAGIINHTGGASSLYKRIKGHLEYKHTPEYISAELVHQLNMVKDHAQY